MKLLLIAVAVSVISVQILANEIDTKERLQARQDCKKESGVEDKVLEAALKGDFKEDDKLKKQCKCFFEKLGVMKGNDINDEKLKEYVKVALPDKKNEAEQITQECSQKKEKEPEETAFQVSKCVLEKKKQ